MGEVIYLSARRGISRRTILQGLGFDRPDEWEAIGFLNPHFSYGGLDASPHVAARHRGSGACRFIFISQESPTSTPADTDVYGARFPAYVAVLAIRATGQEVHCAEVGVVFQDGSRVMLDPIGGNETEFDALLAEVGRRHREGNVAAERLVPRLVREKARR